MPCEEYESPKQRAMCFATDGWKTNQPTKLKNTKQMKKVITDESLKDMEKAIGSKGSKKGGVPFTDGLHEKTKKHRVA